MPLSSFLPLCFLFRVVFSLDPSFDCSFHPQRHRIHHPSPPSGAFKFTFYFLPAEKVASKRIVRIFLELRIREKGRKVTFFFF